MRVVIDTNCFLAILPKVSPYRPAFDAYRFRQFELAVSTEILDEYAEVFGQRMTPLISDNLLELIDKQINTIRTEIYYRWGAITKDYDDRSDGPQQICRLHRVIRSRLHCYSRPTLQRD